MWYGLTIQNQSESSGMGADVHIAPTSSWFQGHFPGRPVLPGIAQLGLIFDLVQQGFNHPVSLVDISRVRFKKLILPGDCIRIEAVPKADKEGVYAFRILKGDELISSGNLTVKKRAETAETITPLRP